MKLPDILLCVLIILAISCDKELSELDKYPTTIHKADIADLEEVRAKLHRENIYLHTSVNDFMFTDYKPPEVEWDAPLPLPADTISREEAIEIIMQFVNKNSKLMGVNNPDDLTFERSEQYFELFNGSSAWYFLCAMQMIDTIEVPYRKIQFRIVNRELVSCLGNWFPEIYIPRKFIISKESAKAQLVDKIITVHCWTSITDTLTQDAVDAATTDLEIIPVESDENIKLHVVWKITIPLSIHPIFYIDVMTGEEIRQSAEIIC